MNGLLELLVMWDPDLLAVVSFLAVIQSLGLVAALASRVSAGSRWQGWWQGLFLALLPLAGLSTLLAFHCGRSYGLVCATLTAVTALTAICDFHHGRRQAA